MGHLEAADLLRQGAGEGASSRSRTARFREARWEWRHSSSVMKGRFLRGLSRWMARATSSLPVPVSPRIKTLASVGATTSTCRRTRRRAALLPDHLLEVLLDLDVFVVDILKPVALPQILHKSDPSEGRELQHGRGNQDRDAGSVFPNQLFLKRRAGSEPQTFFMRQLIQRGVFRRSEIGPVQPARQQIFAAVSDQFEKRIIRLGNAVELTGNDAGDGRFRRDRPDARAAAPQFLVPARGAR